jgi:hypothetical protein
MSYKSCVFCGTPNVKYTCCLERGCKMCDFCYNELFVETKYGFAPKSLRVNWYDCPVCQREIVLMTSLNGKGGLTCKWSGFQFVKNVQSLTRSHAGMQYSS